MKKINEEKEEQKEELTPAVVIDVTITLSVLIAVVLVLFARFVLISTFAPLCGWPPIAHIL